MHRSLLLTGLTLICLPFFSLASQNTKGYQWPIDTERKLQISSTFAESRIDHFHNGVDIPGSGLKVRPVHSGRVVWMTQARSLPGELPFGGGKTILVEHGDTWSGYMHLSDIEPQIYKNSMVKDSESLGISGNTGHSGGAHLHFFIFQPEKNIMYNPLLILDEKYYTDNKQPEILEYAAAIDDQSSIFKAEKEILLSQDFPILAKILDRGVSSERWGVYSLKISRSNRTLVRTFDKLQYKDGYWRDNNGDSFENVYFKNYLILGTGFRENPDFSLQASGLRGPGLEKNINLKIKRK